MNKQSIIENFWQDMNDGLWNNLQTYFVPQATIDWVCTNERFTVPEFVRANTEYPDEWDISVVHLTTSETEAISTVQVTQRHGTLRFFATSYFTFQEDKIIHLTEYWADCGQAPVWRTALGLGTSIL